jgi:hypothetical protein
MKMRMFTDDPKRFVKPWQFCSAACFHNFNKRRTDGAAERVAAFLKKKEAEIGSEALLDLQR